MKTDCVYEIACSNLGIEKLETAEQFADLYEQVTRLYDKFNDEMDNWPVWYTELSEAEDYRSWRQWMLGKLSQGEDVLSLTEFLRGEFGIPWSKIVQVLSGNNKSDTLLARKLTTVDDWVELQATIRTEDGMISYSDVRKFLRSKGADLHGTPVSALVSRFGGLCVTRSGEPWAGRKKPDGSGRYSV